ncbi:CRISPR-associated protein Cas4 [Heliobacterium undosum]|uniref:CRISPR-associated exonuclease Cas4 n=2 Tax=Heliomicrobium undosum TaxID=121734 RepID=A0A845L7L4_9FIRM|nr:CRISPR-associated protein Cas4 [Heliomicrobium undosum]MZP30794.1 CRISPR-associated protein Cas4 [Heliomicrobium undosum]
MAFCERQWALIHLEKQWKENLQTMEGRILHERVHDPLLFEKRGDRITARAVPLVSRRLGIYGVADVIEYHRVVESLTDTENETAMETVRDAPDPAPEAVAGFAPGAVRVAGKDGMWRPYPVEYKRGRPKKDNRDRVQLCAQAMCLEEMYHIRINAGYLYYGEIRRREAVELDEHLRKEVEDLALRMHELYERGATPPPLTRQGPCKLCSLRDTCMPRLPKTGRVTDYVRNVLKDIQEERGALP